MRRMLGLLVAALLVAAPVSAQDDGDEALMEFISVAGYSDAGAALVDWANDLMDPDAQARVRAALEADTAAMLTMDPDPCWLPVFLDYWTAVRFASAALDAVEDFDLTGAAMLVGLAGDTLGGSDPSSVGACLG